MDKHRALAFGDCDHADRVDSDKKIPLAKAPIPIIAMARMIDHTPRV
jgi:hypothetical protein